MGWLALILFLALLYGLYTAYQDSVRKQLQEYSVQEDENDTEESEESED